MNHSLRVCIVKTYYILERNTRQGEVKYFQKPFIKLYFNYPKMEDLTRAYLTPLPPDSPYVKPYRFIYTQNGKVKDWDLLKVHDSVAVLIFNTTRNVMVFVKQFRPAIYFNSLAPEDRNPDKEIDTSKYPASLGITLELCAGIVDKNANIDVIAKEEILEEVGYNVDVKSLEKVLAYRSGVGVQGARQDLFYCEVTDDMKVTAGGGIDDELIEVVEKTIPEVEEILKPKNPTIVNSPPSFLYGLMWFIHHKADKFRKLQKRATDASGIFPKTST